MIGAKLWGRVQLQGRSLVQSWFDMRKPARHKSIFIYYSYISYNLPRHLFCRILNSPVHGFLVSLSSLVQPQQKRSIVNLPATIKQNWCRDDGLESLMISVEVVLSERTTAQQALDHYLEVKESRPHPSWIHRHRWLGQAQDLWWFCEREEFAENPFITLSPYVGGPDSVCIIYFERGVLWALD